MYKILNKQSLNSTVTLMEIEAPLVAKKAEPGQFIILRVDDEGERVPLTIADYDRLRGTITIIFQIVGATTYALNQKNEGDYIRDFVGPLGVATHPDFSVFSWFFPYFIAFHAEAMASAHCTGVLISPRTGIPCAIRYWLTAVD